MPLPLFYPIIDTGMCRERGLDPDAVAAATLRGGARLLQLRHKRPPAAGDDVPTGSAEFLERAERMAGLAAEYGAALIVNDRADIARLCGAGVHVGQEDLPVADVRRIVGPEAIVGISTHDEDQVNAALLEPATYLAVGPVFHTGTKQTGYEARGLDLVRYAANRGMPVVAIGGLTVEGACQAVEAGASSVAVITGLLTGGDPERRTADYLAALAAVRARADL